MTRVPVHPEMLRWARERAGQDLRDLALRFPQLQKWERGEKQPTFKQLESFAKATHTPFGYLFLREPPEEPLPIPVWLGPEGEGISGFDGLRTGIGGRLTFKEAYDFAGLRGEAFQGYARRLGMDLS